MAKRKTPGGHRNPTQKTHATVTTARDQEKRIKALEEKVAVIWKSLYR